MEDRPGVSVPTIEKFPELTVETQRKLAIKVTSLLQEKVSTLPEEIPPTTAIDLAVKLANNRRVNALAEIAEARENSDEETFSASLADYDKMSATLKAAKQGDNSLLRDFMGELAAANEESAEAILSYAPPIPTESQRAEIQRYRTLSRNYRRIVSAVPTH